MDTSNQQDLILCYFHLRFSFQYDISHQLSEKLAEVDNFQTWKYMISLWIGHLHEDEGSSFRGRRGQRRHHAHAAEDDEPSRRDPDMKVKILQVRMNMF